MSDTSRDQASLLWTAKPRAARVARPGEFAWRLRHADGSIQRCESDVGFGAFFKLLGIKADSA